MQTLRPFIAALVLGALWPAVARAQPQDLRPVPGAERMFGGTGSIMMPLVLNHANLSPEQTQQVQRIMESDRRALRALFRQLEDANEQLTNRLFAPGQVQESDLAPDVQHVMQLRQQVMEQGIQTALAIRAVLTPEQVTKVSQLKDRIQTLHAEMRSIVAGRD